jgi:hypothetical protein
VAHSLHGVVAETSVGLKGVRVSKSMSEGQRAYEARRAAKAGVSLERWLADKERERQAEARAAAKADAARTPKKRGLFSRLLDRAHRPL